LQKFILVYYILEYGKVLQFFSTDLLKEKYGIYAVRVPRGKPHSLNEALKGD